MKEKIKELKKTAKGKAILKLIRWIIFFIAIFIFCFIASLINSSNTNNVGENDPVTDILKFDINILNDLINSDYSYSYEVMINEENYKFNGTNKSNIINGYKETKEDIIKYYIDNTGTYQVINDTNVLISNLYDGINEDYINLEYIYNILKDKLIEYKDLYTTNDNINNYSISYNEEDKYISKIEIKAKDNTYSYVLNFDNVRGR